MRKFSAAASPIRYPLNYMKEIQLTKGQSALVDDADYEWLNQWHWQATWTPSTSSYYATRALTIAVGRRYTTSMHRQILGLERGDKRHGDHINHDTLDNQRHNLRIATHTESLRHQRLSAKSTTGYKGVRKSPSGRYTAEIKHLGKKIYLGTANTPEGAAELYNQAAIELHGEFAFLNLLPTALPSGGNIECSNV